MSILSKELSFLLVIAWLFTLALPVGGLIGFSVGKLMTTILRQSRKHTIVDVLLGFSGFAVGALLSTVGFSVEEQWENGLLVYRKTTGLGDHLILLAVVGATIFVAGCHLLLYGIQKLRNREPDSSLI